MTYLRGTFPPPALRTGTVQPPATAGIRNA
jgi:hypothetical protein